MDISVLLLKTNIFNLSLAFTAAILRIRLLNYPLDTGEKPLKKRISVFITFCISPCSKMRSEAPINFLVLFKSRNTSMGTVVDERLKLFQRGEKRGKKT